MKYTKLWQVPAVVVMAVAAMVFALGAASAGGGSLTISVDGVELPLDDEGEVRDEGDRLEIRDRQHEGEFGTFPVTINGTGFLADEIKVISNLKVRDGASEHRGTIEIDIDSIPGGRITLEYRGTATISGSTASGFTIVSSGEFKVTKATDMFEGIRAEGGYDMTIMESGSSRGDLATVTVSASGI